MAVITDILNFARVDAGRVEYAMERVVVAEVLGELRSLVAPQLEYKSLSLDLDECDPAIAVRADREKLRQVLLNLVANAIKFTGDGGRITIACVEDSAAGTATIRVRDTGVGIPADRLDSIFEPFVQLHRTLSQPVEGTGLGLAISRDLARGMHGDLSAESTEGKGATFTLTLPIDC
jgi:signal transduction histidine kinase